LRRIIVTLSGVAILVLLAIVFGCDLPGEARSAIDVVYPADGSIFPPDFTAPTFLWRDKNAKANHWAIEITASSGSEPLRFSCPGDPPPPGEIDAKCVSKTNEIFTRPADKGPLHSWTPDAKTWKRIQKQCSRPGATVIILGFGDDRSSKALSTGRIAISVSPDPVGAPIFYRDVPLIPAEMQPDENTPIVTDVLPLIVWRLRDVAKPASRVVMKDMPTCANCHTFSRDGKTLGFDIDGPSGDKGAYTMASVAPKMVIESKDLITWNSFPDKPKGKKTIGFMSQVSPDGLYAVSTVNESIYVANFTDYKFLQVFFPTRGILAYYSRQTGLMKALPGADNSEYVHCNPAWSSDGKYLVFARATAIDPYPPDAANPQYANDPKELQIQYDLYRIPFNDGQGGEPEPIAGASQNGMSNTFPRISPDGRWIVFVKCSNGQLMRPDSRLWIVPTAGGKAREMRCNTSLMNSWHSFSPNGRWMVFSSKGNTPYTQMFLTHIDEDGVDSPAILIPNSTAANRAVNLPEFANIAYDDLVSINVPAVDWRRPLNRAKELLNKDQPEQALKLIEESLRRNPTQAQTHFLMGRTLDKLKRTDKAVEHYVKALELDPQHFPSLNELGVVLDRQGKFDQAIEHFRKAAAADPGAAFAHNNWGKTLMNLGKFDQAIAHFRKALKIDPANAMARICLEKALRKQGENR
jgi:tetratricopeptide (TPR) repeat protein